MEAERRSTMSSLKGQLSNVEGSVKSMKAAVVVGSVLTVACLAAVFGVTVLANEVSKEVKVSNGTLSTKSGKSVLTASTFASQKIGAGAKTIGFELNGASVAAKVDAVVVQGETTTTICDDLVLVEKNGVSESMQVATGSVMESLLNGETETEKRNLNSSWGAVAKWASKAMGLWGWALWEFVTLALECLGVIDGWSMSSMVGFDCDAVIAQFSGKE